MRRHLPRVALARAGALAGASALLSTLLVTGARSGAAAATVSLPVYNVVQEGMTPDQGAQLSRAFNIPDALQSDGSFSFSDSNRFQAVPQVTVGRGTDKRRRATVSQALDMNALAQLTPLPDERALAQASEFLKMAGLNSDLAATPSVSHAQLTLADAKGQTTDTFALDTTVTFQLTLNRLPVTGDGAKLRVSFAEDGSVTQMSDSLRQLSVGRPTPIITAAQATNACTALYGSRVQQLTPTLGYQFPALTAQSASGRGTVQTLFPQYTCHPVGPLGEQAGRLIPAVASSAPHAVLTVTKSGDSMSAEVSTPTGGTAPYSYKWSSSTTALSASLEGGSRIDYTRTPRNRSTREQVTMEVSDSNGITATAAVVLSSDGTASAATKSGGGGLAVLSRVGIEQTVDEWQCAQDSANGFRDVMASHGVGALFDWRGSNAWENDFEDPAFGGSDHNWVDNVDAQWYTGHGNANGFSFKGSNDSTFIGPSEISWGDHMVDWVQLESCDVLADTTGTNDYFSRWGPTFDGLHVLNGFHTVATCVGGGTGGDFASYLFPATFAWWTLRPAFTVRQAWASMAVDKEPSGTVYRSMGPIGPGGVTNIGDHFWGQGSVGPDVFASQEVGFWSITGTV